MLKLSRIELNKSKLVSVLPHNFLSHNLLFHNNVLVRHSRFVSVMLLLIVSSWLSSCAWFGKGTKKIDTVDGALVFYSEKEPGGEAFKTRIFVTKKYLHVSDDRKAKGFILFDRITKTIYNVNDDDKTIMLIESARVTKPSPIEINYKETSQPSGAIPSVNGNKAMHYRFTANGKPCYNVVALGANFIPELSTAMSEFRTVLAGEHAKTLGGTPKDMLDACDLALNIYHPIDHLKNGFPLREWSSAGYSRFIIYYRTTDKMKLKDLELPDDYKQFSATAK